MLKRQRPTLGIAMTLFVAIALLNIGLGGCGGSTTGTPVPTGPTTPPTQQGLQIENAITSCCRFIAVNIINLGTGSSNVTSGLNVLPGAKSQVFSLSPGSYDFQVQEDVGGTFVWTNTLFFTVNSNQVTLMTVVLS